MKIQIGTFEGNYDGKRCLVPERGARLGNFGVTQLGGNTALVTVTEWMQPAGGEKHGSTNALFVTRVSTD